MATIAFKSSAGLSPSPRTLQFGDGSVYDENGTQITGPRVNAKAGLPSLTTKTSPPVQTSTGGSSVANTSQDPMTIFNTNLFQMLQDAQKTQNSPALLNERNRLQLLQTQNSMGSASDLGLNGLNPADALAARQNASKLYDPEIHNLTDRMQAATQAVTAFKDSIDAATKYGEQYAKTIKPTPEVIAAAQAMLEAGHNPSSAVLDKVSQYIDWGKVAQADQAIKNKNKAGGGGTQSEKEGVFTNDTRTNFTNSKGVDGKINPDGYRAAMNEYERKGYGSIEAFKKLFPPEVWLDPNNIKDDLTPAFAA